MKTFRIGIACAAMMAFLMTVTGCGETSDKASLKTKAETKSAADSQAEERTKPATDEQPTRSADAQVKQSQATTDLPPAADAIEIPLDRIWT